MKSSNAGSKLNGAKLSMLVARMNVAEVYSPPRVVEVARKIGLREGWGLDLSTRDEDGRAWDFYNLEMRNRAVIKLLKGRPSFFIGSPRCTAHSTMNNTNYARMTREDVNERTTHARTHFEFCIKAYRVQLREGRYVVRERPTQQTHGKRKLCRYC